MISKPVAKPDYCNVNIEYRNFWLKDNRDLLEEYYVAIGGDLESEDEDEFMDFALCQYDTEVFMSDPPALLPSTWFDRLTGIPKYGPI